MVASSMRLSSNGLYERTNQNKSIIQLIIKIKVKFSTLHQCNVPWEFDSPNPPLPLYTNMYTKEVSRMICIDCMYLDLKFEKHLSNARASKNANVTSVGRLKTLYNHDYIIR